MARVKRIATDGVWLYYFRDPVPRRGVRGPPLITVAIKPGRTPRELRFGYALRSDKDQSWKELARRVAIGRAETCPDPTWPDPTWPDLHASRWRGIYPPSPGRLVAHMFRDIRAQMRGLAPGQNPDLRRKTQQLLASGSVRRELIRNMACFLRKYVGASLRREA